MRKLESKLTEELIEGHWCLLERECVAKICVLKYQGLYDARFISHLIFYEKVCGSLHLLVVYGG